jgi:hypothetical protein
MAIIDTLKAAQGGAALAELGKAFGLDARQAETVVSAIVPELTRKVERNTLSRGGLADLVQALGQGHHREYLRNPALYRHSGAIEDGKGILDHLVGGKDGSRGIADRAARASGVDAAVIREMLPVVARGARRLRRHPRAYGNPNARRGADGRRRSHGHSRCVAIARGRYQRRFADGQ